jgi:hypothetical protein
VSVFNKYVEQREARGQAEAQAFNGDGGGGGFSGTLLRIAAVLSALMIAAAVILLYQTTRAENLSKQIRVRSSFSLATLRLNQMALTRESYITCLGEGAKCGVKIAAFEEEVRQYPGVEPEAFSYDEATLTVRGSLKSTAPDVQIEKQKIAIQLPKDLLSATKSSCTADEPVLTGFDQTGRALCRKLVSTECDAGEYVSSIDPLTLQVKCLPAGREVSCNSGEYIANFEWQGADRVSYSCKPRLDPFTAWNFKPSLQRGEALNDSAASAPTGGR